MLARRPVRPAHAAVDQAFAHGVEYFEVFDDCAVGIQFDLDLALREFLNVFLQTLQRLEVHT